MSYWSKTLWSFQDMESVLWKFAAREEHKSSDSTFLVFMSHGILDGICGTMHSVGKPDVLPYDTIFQIFNNRNCLSLKDKPKVIIVQACRGGELWDEESKVHKDHKGVCNTCFISRWNNLKLNWIIRKFHLGSWSHETSW